MDFTSALPLESGNHDVMPFADSRAVLPETAYCFPGSCVSRGTALGVACHPKYGVHLNTQNRGSRHAVTARLHGWKMKGITATLPT